ncbi:hypothetical protein OUZ56_015862 [Daphnia magna]|uniref:Uncharacterized protein n=1 Tax=Daphnia magna TaxID=35525 RepID=A0ABR0ANY2_9CRUS|nr:hypothetical protein OUZ56_015862 [Daphnia magna]
MTTSAQSVPEEFSFRLTNWPSDTFISTISINSNNPIFKCHADGFLAPVWIAVCDLDWNETDKTLATLLRFEQQSYKSELDTFHTLAFQELKSGVEEPNSEGGQSFWAEEDTGHRGSPPEPLDRRLGRALPPPKRTIDIEDHAGATRSSPRILRFVRRALPPPKRKFDIEDRRRSNEVVAQYLKGLTTTEEDAEHRGLALEQRDRRHGFAKRARPSLKRTTGRPGSSLDQRGSPSIPEIHAH